MVSSLATQLAQNASLNSSLLLEKTRRAPAESYLFTGRDADQHDLESTHALGRNGFLQLVSLKPALRTYEQHLFSDAIKDLDRTLISKDQNKELDVQIGGFLRAIGPFLLEGPAGKVLEWLVRRFRIHEFNCEDVLALFLPYHESPHFAKMVTILHIPQNSTWSFLRPFKSAAQSLSRVPLVTEMLKNTDVARFVTKLVPESIKKGNCHRTLLAFNAACLHDFMVRSERLDEGTMTFVLAALLEPLQHRNEKASWLKDAILGSYILLCAFSQKCTLRPAAIEHIILAVSKSAHSVSTTQYLNAAIAICEPQQEVEVFSQGVLTAVIALNDIKVAMSDVIIYEGSEKFAGPLLAAGLSRLSEPEVYSVCEIVLTHPATPRVLISQLSTLLVKGYLTQENNLQLKSQTRRLLSHIHQRHASVLHSAVSQLASDNEVIKESLDQLLISLSLSTAGPSSNASTQIAEMVISSSSADVAVRVIAVERLFTALGSQTIPEGPDAISIKDALKARMHDTSTEVLEHLFQHSETLAPLLVGEPSYIPYLKRVLFSESSKPKRAFVRAHISFILAHLSSQPSMDSAELEQLFHEILFPLLLLSKSKQKLSENIWDLVSENQGRGLAAHPWISGCAAIWEDEKEKSSEDTIAKMALINQAISSQISENIGKSAQYAAHLQVLLKHLQSEEPYHRSLTYLVVQSLLTRLSGERQIEFASIIVANMSLEKLSDTVDKSKLENPTALGQTVVNKTSHRTTLQLLQTHVVITAASLPKPDKIALNWLASGSGACLRASSHDSSHAHVFWQGSTDTGSRYVRLLRTVYKLANTVSGTLTLISSVFSKTADETLAFLVGFCLELSQHDHSAVSWAITVALKHAAAFLMARLGEDRVIDFQTVLPPLLIILLSVDKEGRQAVLDCLAILTQLSEKKFTGVYCMDTLYGNESIHLQFLERSDYTKYLTLLNENSEHLLNDPDYLKVLHQEHLSRVKTDKRKQADYKQHIICSFLSHLQCLESPPARITLLKTLETVSDKTKAEMVEPLLLQLVKPEASAELSEKFGSRLEVYSSLIIGYIDPTAAAEMNAPDSSLWGSYTTALEAFFSPNGAQLARETLSARLRNGLFAALKVDRQSSLCRSLLKIAATHAQVQTRCKSLLNELVREVPLMVLLLAQLEPADSESSSPSTKRTKLSQPQPSDPVTSLSLFAEVLANRPLPGSFELISKLLDALSNLVHRSSTTVDINYTEQLLMTAIGSSAEKIQEIPNSTPNGIRLDILVELIRSSDNPQTFQQALLLMARLTRLSPESALHNVMPVFTFMGTNVFHRDDAYSFSIVQETVNNIVPVMISSLRESHTQKLDLMVASRDFLKIFTDASTHIPRHRRTNFFNHLVDVLGPQDFLTPVLLLLVDKVTNRVVKQSPEEAQASLRLVLSIVQHYSDKIKINVLTDILEECRRILRKLEDPENTDVLFLEAVVSEDHSIPVALVYRRRIQALVTFVGFGFKAPSATGSSSPSGSKIGSVVTHLTHLATVEGQQLEDIRKASSAAVMRAMEHMSVTDFVDAALVMLQSEQPLVQVGSLDLITSRLPDVAEASRQGISATMNKILASLRNILHSCQESPLAKSALRALAVIASSSVPDEASTLTAIVPSLVALVRNRTMLEPALDALHRFPSKLGPRLLPSFRDIITVCASALREGPEGLTDSAWLVLNNLLLSMSTFWGGAELIKVINLCLDASSSTHGPNALIKTLTKNTAAKILLPTLAEMWPSLEAAAQQGKEEKVSGYFDILKRAVRNADKDVVIEQLRAMFKLFLSALEVTVPSSEAQGKAISAFVEMVAKLNDATFKPLFRRLFDWAFKDASDTSVPKRISFSDVYLALLDFFKGLIVPYMSFVFQPSIELLKAFSAAGADSPELWSRTLQVISKSMDYDDGVFWRDDKARQFYGPLVQQIPVCNKLFSPSSSAKSLLQQCIVSLAENTSDDVVLKSINLDVLLYTRSEEARVRLLALSCSEALWTMHAGKMLAFAAETATFIAECAEDENDDVVQATVKLKEAVESVAGAINGL